jgi:uncharacterized protein YbbK (DUF523 family)
MTALRFITSACLAGVKCRYNGKDKQDKTIYQSVKKGQGLPLCPEQLGGLPTPRRISRIKSEQGRKFVISSKGEDLTELFSRGARLSFLIGQRFKINSAYLEIGSPSCGSSLKNGKNKIPGITAALFDRRGMKIFAR